MSKRLSDLPFEIVNIPERRGLANPTDYDKFWIKEKPAGALRVATEEVLVLWNVAVALEKENEELTRQLDEATKPARKESKKA